MCISQTMRSLDTALREGDDEVSPRVELVLMAAEPEGGYRFELRVASERLTKA